MPGRKTRVLAGGLLCALLPCATMSAGAPAAADNPRRGRGENQKPGRPAPRPARNPFMKTLGGLQFWGDRVHFNGWRIQQNVLDGTHRLIDPDDYQHQAGTFAECRLKLEEFRRELKLKPSSREAVVLVHGIIRSSKSFSRLAKELEQQGFDVVGFDYPSTRVDIGRSAEFLQSTVQSLKHARRIHFVVHSMGGLVVRSYLSRNKEPRLGRLVMLGVPNNGAHLANLLQQNSLYKAVMGPAGQQLIRDPDGTISRLPVPAIPFAVIAGGRNNDKGFNPVVPGDDDGTVSVDSTRLPGAVDFAVVSCLHSFLMNDRDAIKMTTQFLKAGKLRKDEAARPIPRIQATGAGR